MSATMPIIFPGWVNVKTYGAKGDGSTDDTAAIQSAIDALGTAGGGTLFFPAGIYQLTSAATTVNGSTAQLHLPSVGLTASGGIGIKFMAYQPQSMTPSVVGSVVQPTAGAILRSTATSGAVVGGRYSVSGTYDWTMVNAHVENMTIRLPTNPALHGLDLGYVAGCRLTNVIVDTSEGWNVDGLTQPSTTSQYGVILPRINNGAYTRVDTLLTMGSYTGVMLGEHADIDSLDSLGCFYAVEIGNQNHACLIRRWLDTHCRNGLRVTASSTPHPRLDVLQYAIEYVSTTWRARQADVIDASNLLYGTMRYAVVQAGVGPSTSFTKTGGSNFTCTSVGS